MKQAVLAAAVALMLASPANAEAPTIDQRVQVLENTVALQDEAISKLEHRLDVLEQDTDDAGTTANAALNLASRALPIRCFDALSISKRRTGNLYLTSRDGQSRVYVLMVDHKCAPKAPRQGEDYGWPGFRR